MLMKMRRQQAQPPTLCSALASFLAKGSGVEAEEGKGGAHYCVSSLMAGVPGNCTFDSLCWEDSLHLAQLGLKPSNDQLGEICASERPGMPNSLGSKKLSPVTNLPLLHVSPSQGRPET